MKPEKALRSSQDSVLMFWKATGNHAVGCHVFSYVEEAEIGSCFFFSSSSFSSSSFVSSSSFLSSSSSSLSFLFFKYIS
jgi:hypothetical protein